MSNAWEPEHPPSSQGAQGQRAPEETGTSPGPSNAAGPPAPDTATTYGSGPGNGQAKVPAWLAGIPQQAWVRAAVITGMLFAGGLIGAALIAALSVGPAVGSELGETFDTGGQWLPLLLQTFGAGFVSPWHLTTSGLAESGSIHITIFAVPLLVPLFGLLAVRFIARHVVPRTTAPSWGPRLVLGAASGLAFAIVTTLLVALVPLRVTDSGVTVTLRAASFPGFLAQFVIAAAVVVISFLPARAGAARKVTRAVVDTVAEHLGSLALLIGITGVIWLAVRSHEPSLLRLAPLFVPFFGLSGVGLVHLVPLSAAATGASGEDIPFLGDLNDLTVGSSVSLFSDVFPRWLVPVAVLVAVIWLLVASVRWRARRGMPGRSALGWLPLLGGYAAAGFVLLFGTMVSLNVDVSAPGYPGYQAGSSVSLAGWVFLVFALLGLVVEALSRFVVTPALKVLPPGLFSVLTFAIPRVPVAPERAPAAAGAQGSAESNPATAPGPGTPGADGTAVPDTEATYGTPTGYAAAPAGAAGWAASGPDPEAGPDGWGEIDRHSASTRQQSGPDEPRAAGAPLAPGGRRLSRAAKRGWLITGLSVVVVAVLCVAAGLTVSSLGKGKYGPQQKVDDYLSAVVNGKASDALKILDPNVVNDQRALLADKVYAAATNRPTGYEVDKPVIDGDNALVNAHLTQDGKSYDLSFTLVKDGKQAGIFSDWRVTSGGQQSIRVASAPEKMQVNGADVTLRGVSISDVTQDPEEDGGTDDDGESAGVDFPVLPGDYTFSAPKGSKYVSYGDDVTVHVVPGSAPQESSYDTSSEDATATEPVVFQPTYTQAVITDTTAQVEEAIKACTTSTAIHVKDCEAAGWDSKYWKAIRKLHREWAATPEVRITNKDHVTSAEYSDQERADELRGSLVALVTDGDIKISYEGRDEDGDDWNDEDRTYDPFTVADGEYGSDRMTFPITIDGDDLKVDLSALHKENPQLLRKD